MSSEAPSGHQSSSHSDPCPYDDLADLFLGDDSVPAPSEPDQQTVTLSTLIVGHLPVISAPWVAQHARDVARAGQCPVAVLSRSGDRTTLDLYNSPKLAEQQTIDGAIEQALAAGCKRWLIRTDAVSELSVFEHSRVDTVTLLTGADDAAVVGAYRAIKGLVADTSELDEHSIMLNLAVMGSDPAKARAAAEKIRKAAQSFLQAGLADVTLSEKVSAGGTSHRIFDDTSDIALDMLLDLVPSTIQLPTPPASRPDPTPSSLRLSHEPVEPAAEPVVPAAKPMAPKPAAPAAVETETISASRVGPMETSPKSQAAMLGLTSIEARCPYADEIEIAADHEGRAHLIASTEGQDIARALESLQIARAWIGAHISLLSSATGGKIRSNPPLETSQHLIVEHAASARRLLDSDMSVYVMARGNHESLCVPLN